MNNLYWCILNCGIEQAFIPFSYAKNENEAIDYYKNFVLNKWQRERYKKFTYTAKVI
jgi:hypothetical protein